MKRRGFTLMEILITIVIIGMITASLFPLLILNVKDLNRSFAFTEAGFEAQTKIEEQIKDLYNLGIEITDPSDPAEMEENDRKKMLLAAWPDDGAELKIDLFGVKDIAVLPKSMETEKKNIGTGKDYVRKITAFIPKAKAYAINAPTVTVNLMQSGNQFESTVNYKTNVLTGKSWKDSTEFCVYRWYIGPYKGADPKLTTLTLIREYNMAKLPESERPFEKGSQFKYKLKGDYDKENIRYGSELFTVIADGAYAFIDGNTPLIKAGIKDKWGGDKFKLDDINMKSDAGQKFTDREKSALYAGTGIVFSAMPVTTGGEVGKETFSKMIELKVPREKLQLAMAPVFTTAGADNYKVRFLIKQVDNNQKNYEYTFTIKDLATGEVYYPKYYDAEKTYFLNPKPQKTRVLKTDDDGFAVFNVVMRKDRQYEINILDSEQVIMVGDVDLTSAP